MRLGLAIIALFSLLALKSLISVPFYTSHDGFTHTARIAAYYQAVKSGQFPPRWAANFYDGRGSPIFVYSYPLPYALGAAFHFGGLSYQDSFRLLMALGFILAGVNSFFWLRNRFGDLAGLGGSIFYLWVPYRFLNIYVRGALAENLAYGLVPLVFLGIDQKRWRMTVLTMAAVLLAHNEVAALTLPIFLTWAWLQKRLKFFLTASLGAFALAAFIYLPDFFERDYIRFDQGISYYQNHFVSWWQFLRSPWGYGFDFSGTIGDSMSFQLGLAQLLVLVLLAGAMVWRKKLPSRETIFFLGVLGVSVFLMTDSVYNRRAWEVLPVIKTIVDFPWRFLGITTISFAFLTALFLSLVRHRIVMTVFLLIAVATANRNHLNINLPQEFANEVFNSYQGSATAVSDEYRPVWDLTRQVPEQTFNPSRISRYYFPDTEVVAGGRALTRGRDWEVGQDGLIYLTGLPLGQNYSVNFKETPLRRAANVISIVTAGVIFLSLILWRRKSIF